VNSVVVVVVVFVFVVAVIRGARTSNDTSSKMTKTLHQNYGENDPW
jgi:hypothetical protein